MNTAAAWSHERTPGPTEAEAIADGLARDLATIIRSATGPKRGRPPLARGNMIPIAAAACREAIVSLLIDDHRYAADTAREVADKALYLAIKFPPATAETRP